MTDVERIITDLERQRDAIERAIAALREITPAGQAPPKRSSGSPAQAKRQLSPEGRQRIVQALKKRWAAKRRAQSSAGTQTTARKTGAQKKAGGKKAVSKKAARKTTTASKAPAESGSTAVG